MMKRTTILLEIRREIQSFRDLTIRTWRNGMVPKIITEEVDRYDKMIAFLDREIEVSIDREMLEQEDKRLEAGL